MIYTIVQFWLTILPIILYYNYVCDLTRKYYINSIILLFYDLNINFDYLVCELWFMIYDL